MNLLLSARNKHLCEVSPSRSLFLTSNLFHDFYFHVDSSIHFSSASFRF